jgi:hypothetical protein
LTPVSCLSYLKLRWDLRHVSKWDARCVSRHKVSHACLISSRDEIWDMSQNEMRDVSHVTRCLMPVLSQVKMRYETCLKMRCEMCLMSQGVSCLSYLKLRWNMRHVSKWDARCVSCHKVSHACLISSWDEIGDMSQNEMWDMSHVTRGVISYKYSVDIIKHLLTKNEIHG